MSQAQTARVVKSRWQTGARVRRNRSAGRRLAVESLERRMLLTIFWDNDGSSNNWNDPLNWSGDQLPGPGDHVVIDVPQTVMLDIDIGAAGALGSFTLDDPGAKIFTDGHLLTVNGPSINKGTVDWEDGTWAGTGTLSNLGTLRLERATIDTHVVNSGTLEAHSSSNSITGTLTNQTGGQVQLQGALAVTGGPLHNQSGGEITVLSVDPPVCYLTAELDNQGTVNVQEQVIIDALGAQHLNTGLIHNAGASGSSLNVQFKNFDTFQNDGTISMTAGNLLLDTFTTFTNNGSVTAASGQQLIVKHGTVVNQSGATLATLDTDGRLHVEYSTLRIDGTYSAGDGLLELFDTTVEPIPGGTGTLSIAGTAKLTDAVISMDVVNSGTVEYYRDGNTISGQLTNQPGALLQVLGVRSNNVHDQKAKLAVSSDVNNAGTLDLSGLNAPNYYAAPWATLEVTGGTLINQSTGVIRTLVGGFGGGTRCLIAELDNQGTLNVQESTQITGVGANHLNSGTIDVDGDTLILGYFNSLTNAGNVDIDGTGRINVVGGAYLQTAGLTDVAGVLQVTGTGALVDLQGGTLRGTGLVTGDVLNSAEVVPGNSAGTLQINGDYTQTAAGLLGLEIGGEIAGVDNDLLDISGSAAFDGTLNVEILAGFTPTVGDTFEVINYASHTGQFAAVSGAGGCCGGFVPVYNPTFVELEYTSAGNHITALIVSPDPAPEEGSEVTLDGTFTSPDTSNPTQVTISWGDGTDDTVLDLAAGVLTFSAPHVYDDGPNPYTINVTITGHPCGDQSDSTDVTVINVAPTVAADEAVVTVDEAQTAENSGTFSDPGVDAVTLAASVGTVLDNGDGTWSWSLPTTDGPDDGQMVTITATDEDGDSNSTTFELVVNNVAPTVDALDGPTAGVRNQTLSYTAAFSDPGVADTHDTAWEVVDSGGGMVTSGTGTEFSFTPIAADVYTVSVTVTDDDGGSGTAAVDVTVEATALMTDPLDPTQTVLFVGGDLGGENVSLKQGSQPGLVRVMIDGAEMGEFGPGIDRLVVFGGDGDDQLKVHQDLPPMAVELYGGAGNDMLRGGLGTNVLVGGPGDDLISSNDERDLLIGGEGADKILGDEEDDILIGGSYLEETNRAAVRAIMAEWTRTDLLYEDRVNNLINGTGLNGSYVLNDSTVFDDGDRDTLKGKQGFDWFLANLEDDKTDADLDEILTQIELEFVMLP